MRMQELKYEPLVCRRRHSEGVELMAGSGRGLKKSFRTALFHLLPTSVLWSNGQSPWNA
jgi:hypothetical protein